MQEIPGFQLHPVGGNRKSEKESEHYLATAWDLRQVFLFLCFIFSPRICFQETPGVAKCVRVFFSDSMNAFFSPRRTPFLCLGNLEVVKQDQFHNGAMQIRQITTKERKTNQVYFCFWNFSKLYNLTNQSRKRRMERTSISFYSKCVCVRFKVFVYYSALMIPVCKSLSWFFWWISNKAILNALRTDFEILFFFSFQLILISISQSQ